MPDDPWVSAHVFYHEDLDRLLLDVTAPLVTELATDGLATEFFFLRYWDGGPHLRLRVLPTDRAEVERRIRERFEKYLAFRPAADRTTAEEYAESARWLAGLEHVARPLDLQPNNSLAFIPYEREHHKYGFGASVEAVERHFAESSRIVLDLLPVEHHDTAAVAMIMLAWFAGTDDLPVLADRIRQVPLLPGQPEPVVEHQGDRLVELARRMRVLAARWPEINGDGTFLRWARSTGTLRQTLATQAMPRSVFGVLNGCAHLVCNRLGVLLARENELRHRAAAAIGRLAAEGT